MLCGLLAACLKDVSARRLPCFDQNNKLRWTRKINSIGEAIVSTSFQRLSGLESVVLSAVRYRRNPR